jgi:hypothetical protein
VAFQNTSLSGWWRYADWTKVEILLRHRFFFFNQLNPNTRKTVVALCGHTSIGH